jgi:tetratricopeptide (TPR) repeat protein
MMIIGRLRSRSLVAQADAARDRRNWTTAADLYRQALAMAPARTGIWVQLGHVLKESGAREEAAEAYARALALRPRSADIHLQIGHLQKLMGNLGAAAASYGRAVALGGGADAANELHRLGHSIDVDGSATRAERSGSAPRGQRPDIEARLDALSGQISTFLEHVSTTKALAFEVARCKAALEQLGMAVDGAGSRPAAADGAIAALNSQILSLTDRVSALEAAAGELARGSTAAIGPAVLNGARGTAVSQA